MWSASASLVCLERADIGATCGLVTAAPGRQAVRPTPRVTLKRLQRSSVVSAHAAGSSLGCLRSAALVLIPETGMTQGRRPGSAFQVRGARARPMLLVRPEIFTNFGLVFQCARQSTAPLWSRHSMAVFHRGQSLSAQCATGRAAHRNVLTIARPRMRPRTCASGQGWPAGRG